MNLSEANPMYIQIKNKLEVAIRSGQYQKGDKLPSEKELCEYYQVSRITVRKVLEILKNEGVVVSVPGKGSFVQARSIVDNLTKVRPFGEALRQQGLTGHTEILSIQENVTDTGFTMMLADSVYGNPCSIDLCGFLNGEPAVYYHCVLRKPLGRNIIECIQEMEKHKAAFSTFDAYKALDITIGNLDQRILAVNANEKIAKILQTRVNDAVLVLESVLHGGEMRPIEYKLAYYRTDKYNFNLHREIP